MLPVYCISGLGADERVFSKLQLSGCNINFVQWIQPFKKETIEVYANRLCGQITEKQPILIGVSFGGIMAVEIAKHICCKKIILISSIKTSQELPLWMKLCGYLKINRVLVPPRKNPIFIPVENYFLGPKNKEEKQLIDHFRKSVTKEFLTWAIDKILTWKNTFIPPNLLHLIGDRDKFFSVKKAHPDQIIMGGTHFMVYNKADEISTIINAYINDGL
ncbi:MAG: alpha/beta hydrolase [Sphingobacteriales bacterium]|nr:alpha/beta hydrolase [Sphingobacteriales bacterium]